jgi:peptidyl-tRNA hydrolase
MIKNIPISIDFEKIQSDAQRDAMATARSSADFLLATMFKNGRTTWTRPEGIGHEIIRKKVEEYILSDKFAEMVDRLIDEHVEEQATEAVKALLNSRSRKYLFEPIEHKPS